MEKITITALCQEAKISKQTYYNYFKDRQDLIVWTFMNDIEREEDDPAETHLQKLQCALENLW